MKKEFLNLMIGTDKIPEKCIICAGTTKEEWIGRILKIFESHEKIACRGLGCFYLVKYKGRKILLAFNVLGSPVITTLTRLLATSGVKEMIFVGWAGGYKNDVGDYIIPSKTYCADGITTIIKPGTEFVYPDKRLSGRVKKHLDRKGVKYSEGSTFCIIHPHEKVFSRMSRKMKKIKPVALEMELAPYFFISKKNKVPSAAILVISDAKGKSANTKTNQKIRSDSQRKAIIYAAEILTEK